MKTAEIRDLSDDELEQRLDELQKERFALIQDKASGKPEHALRIRTIRREIARVKTIKNEKKA